MYFLFNTTSPQVNESDSRFAIIFLTVINIVGIIINFYLTTGLLFGIRYRGGFFIYCTSKTFANLFTCSLLLFWIVPSIYVNKELNYNFINSVLSHILLFGLYILSILTQWSMSINRWFVICFQSSMKRKTVDLIALGLICSWSGAIGWTFIGFPDCTCTFSPKSLSFIPHDDCHYSTAKLQVYIALIVLIIANIMNVATFTEIVFSGNVRSVSIGSRDNTRRRRKNSKLVIQNCLQCIVYITDAIICAAQHEPHSQIQFINLIIILSSNGVVALIDGLIMLMCNSEIRPACWANRRIRKKSSVISVQELQTTN